MWEETASVKAKGIREGHEKKGSSGDRMGPNAVWQAPQAIGPPTTAGARAVTVARVTRESFMIGRRGGGIDVGGGDGDGQVEKSVDRRGKRRGRIRQLSEIQSCGFRRRARSAGQGWSDERLGRVEAKKRRAGQPEGPSDRPSLLPLSAEEAGRDKLIQIVTTILGLPR